MTKHNKKTCFNCRLQALASELFPNGATTRKMRRRMLGALAMLAAQVLTETDDKDETMKFFYIVKTIRDHLMEGGEVKETLH